MFPTQFIFPSFGRLVEPLGEFSPMGLLWNFMGYSTPYIIFSGLAEVTGATLLLFRRTATLGAMTSAAVLLNIVTLNFCYDVPVKLYSVHLELMSLFLLLPDAPALWRFFVLHQPAAPHGLWVARFQRRWLRIECLHCGCCWPGRSRFCSPFSCWLPHSVHSPTAIHRPRC